MKNIINNILPYLVGLMLAVMGFLGKEVYSQLNDKPSKAEVTVMIENKLKPIEVSVNLNTTKIAKFDIMLKTLIRIDERTIKQGEDIAEIKGKLK